MSEFPPISIRQPQPGDLVDDPVRACGIGTGFEGQITARVRDGDGVQIAQVPVRAGGTGIWGNFDITLTVGVPSTPHGVLEVFDVSAEDGSELNKVVVPLTFGRTLIDPYRGFAQYTVVSGDTLSSIAQKYYGNASKWEAIYEANRLQIEDPDRIAPGQILRIPQ